MGVMSTSDNVSADEIKAALQARRGDWPAISYGAKVSYSWLSKFVNGHIPNPGVATLQKLKAYFAEYPAEERV